MSQLPPDVARKVAHDNVAQIYRLNATAQEPLPANIPTGSNPIMGAKKGKGGT